MMGLQNCGLQGMGNVHHNNLVNLGNLKKNTHSIHKQIEGNGMKVFALGFVCDISPAATAYSLSLGVLALTLGEKIFLLMGYTGKQKCVPLQNHP